MYSNIVTKYLDSLSIQYTLLRHPAVVTTEQSHEIVVVDNCCSCKSLYVKDKKSPRTFLVVLPFDKRADMRGLASYVGTQKFEFVTEEQLFEDLGVHRGSVSPFAFLNEKCNTIPLLIDRTLWESSRIKFHPCDNTATVVLSTADFKRFLQAINKQVIVVE